MATLSRGGLFPPEIVTNLVNKVKGTSALAALCQARPIPFNGQEEFTFSMDKEIDVVAENGAKSAGGITIGTRKIIPVKVEYGARVSDEFMFGAEDMQLDILAAFNEGFARKLARGQDLMAFFGINPRTDAASDVIGTNHFMSAVTQKVEHDSDGGALPDDSIEAAVALVQATENEVAGMAIAPAFRQALAAQKDGDNRRLYPELSWGNTPGSINGLQVQSNPTVGHGNKLLAVVGDFAGSFRWGYAKKIPFKVIEYGNPDNDTSAGDLQGHNQVYLRAEAYLGWAVLNPEAFALITPKAGE